MTNPLDWTAGPFLSLYVLLALIAGIFVVMGRRSLGPPALRTQDHDLGLLDLAWLAGGRDRVADTVMLAFLTAGAAAFDSNAGLVILPEPDPVVVPSEVEPFRGVAAGSWTRRRFHQAVWLQVERVHEGLVQRGLAPRTTQLAWLEVYTVVVLALPIVLGLAKIMVGSSRGKPVGNLVFLVLLTAAFGFFCLIRQPTRTRRGREALERASDEGSRAFRAPQASELALSFAVSGAAVLTGTQFEAFGNMVRPRIEGGGCGSGGDGGGDGGCGGCGC